ncbi:hypothetical protein EI94DRAFT_1795977 [Lactarius quietus]|nr:hypothetical protein EI94DRAFT_1795977 [Lactarius quietus]
MPSLLVLSAPSFPPLSHALPGAYTLVHLSCHITPLWSSRLCTPTLPGSLSPSPPILSPVVLTLPFPLSLSPPILALTPYPSHAQFSLVEPKLVGTPSLDQPRLLKLDSDDSNHDCDPSSPTPRTTQHHKPERPVSRIVTVKDVKAARADVQIRSQCQREEPFPPPH